MKVISDNNIRLFNKINRKYYKKNSVKRYFKSHIDNKSKVSYWHETDWIFFLINNKEQLQNKYILKQLENKIGEDCLQSLLNDQDELFIKMGTEISAFNKYTKKTIIGVFEYIVMTNRDAYFYMFNTDENQYCLVPLFYKLNEL